MSAAIGPDVLASLNEAVLHKAAMDAALVELRETIAKRDFVGVETVREKLHVALDGYVDSYAVAGRRLLHAL